MSLLSKPSSLQKRKVNESFDIEKPLPKTLKHSNGDSLKPSLNLIKQLEENITTSRLHYNGISKLLNFARSTHVSELSEAAASALCRIFSKFIAASELSTLGDLVKDNIIVSQWLKARYFELIDVLLDRLATGGYASQRSTTTILMHLIREESRSPSNDLLGWKTIFFRLFNVLVTGECHGQMRLEFVRSFVNKYHDLKAHTFGASSRITLSKLEGHRLSAVISILGSIAVVPEFENEPSRLFLEGPSTRNSTVRLSRVQARNARTAWANVFKHSLNKGQRKSLLGLLLPKISPWFPQLELLIDFLTDSFEFQGATSLLALSGLFHLIQVKNLDYPYFYEKLYSMLDPAALHSKHRSRFFRLLIICLESTHLPAALAASFIKRLSQLCLFSSPAGTVTVIPLIYNLLNNHPILTFMIQRETPCSQHGLGDEGSKPREPFRADVTDPMKTNAEQNSIWEVKSLQLHYHPNVAIVSKIISEPFYKKAYSTEDFLDHSYNTIIDAELKRNMNRPPIIKYHIGKGVITNKEEPKKSSNHGASLRTLWQFT